MRKVKDQTTHTHTQLSLYNIFFQFQVYCVSSIFYPPTCKACPIATLLHGHCAIYAPLTDPRPLNGIHHTLSVMAISCKG